MTPPERRLRAVQVQRWRCWLLDTVDYVKNGTKDILQIRQSIWKELVTDTTKHRKDAVIKSRECHKCDIIIVYLAQLLPLFTY